MLNKGEDVPIFFNLYSPRKKKILGTDPAEKKFNVRGQKAPIWRRNVFVKSNKTTDTHS